MRRPLRPALDSRTAADAKDLALPLYQTLTVMNTQVDADIPLNDGRNAVPEVMKGCRGKADLRNYQSPHQR
jgi:hypothetical protein